MIGDDFEDFSPSDVNAVLLAVMVTIVNISKGIT